MRGLTSSLVLILTFSSGVAAAAPKTDISAVPNTAAVKRGPRSNYDHY